MSADCQQEPERSCRQARRREIGDVVDADLFVERVRTVREIHDEKSIELPRVVESSRFFVPRA